jgi:holo-[acyl-carrier protein] synthase
VRVGTDIVAMDRLPLTDLAFVRGLLSDAELALFNERKDQIEFLAGRFAAKEAFLKALGTGLSGARLSEIDVSYRKGGQPVLRFRNQEYEISIAHDGGYAIAVVILP